MSTKAEAMSTFAATGQADARLPSGFRAHMLLGLLMFTAVFAYADMQLFALLASRIKTEFNLSDTSLGLTQGVALNLSMALALVPAGLLADKFSRIRLLMYSAALWSLFTLLTGLSSEFWQLFVCRIGLGIAEAAVYPAAYSLIADIYAPKRRAFAVSIFLAGTLAGASGATAISGTLIGAIDAAVATNAGGIWDIPVWRLTFMAAAAPGLVLFIALAMAREPARQEDRAVDRGPPSSEPLVRYIVAERTLLGRLIGAIVLSQVGMFSLFFWLPSAFTRMFGFGAGQAGEWFGSILGIGSLSGIAVGAVLVSVLRQRYGSSAPLVVLSVGVTLTAFAALFLPFAQSPFALALAAAAFIACAYIGVSTAPTVLMAVAPNHLRGRVISLLTLTVMTSTAITPPLVGTLSDNVFTGSSGLILAFSAVAIPCNLIAPLFLLRIRHLFDRSESSAPVNTD